jgi:hypothetical protein
MFFSISFFFSRVKLFILINLDKFANTMSRQ